MATAVAAVATLGSAALGYFSSSKANKQQKKQLEAQRAEAARVQAQNISVANSSYDQISSLIDSTGDVTKYLDQAKGISDVSRKDRMDFVLGDSQTAIRDSQKVNANLANYNFTDVNSSVRNILQSGLYDIASLTRDSTSGSFANLSVQNMAGLAQQCLENTIKTGDFISRISGIDQFTPYRIAQDLFVGEQGKASTKSQAITNKANMITGANNQWFKSFSDVSNASMVLSAQQAANTTALGNNVANSITGYIGMKQGEKNQALSERYMNSLIMANDRKSGISQAIPA